MPTAPTDADSPLPRGLQEWAQRFRQAEIPVLANSAAALEELRLNEDQVDARAVAESIGEDPLMTLKLLAHAASLQRGRRSADPETVIEALVLIGITPFFRAFGPQPTIEDRLAGQPEALRGLQSVLRRAHRAAHFALAFAAHRLDPDAEMIHEAALLHDFAEMLLWVHAPEQALIIRQRQHADPALRSAAVQQEILGVELADVQHALMQAWCLPPLLVDLADDRRSGDAAARCVALAMRLARHTAAGWDDAALPDDVREIAALLTLGTEPTLKLLHEIDGR